MSEDLKNERLAKLEAKFDMFMVLLTEIRDDVKGSPTQNDYDNLKADLADAKSDIKTLEESREKMAIKVYSMAGIIPIIMTLLIKFLMKAV